MKNVLLVEDDRLFSMSLAQMLSDAGFTVRCEYEGQRAIDFAPEVELQAAIIDLSARYEWRPRRARTTSAATKIADLRLYRILSTMGGLAG